MRRFVNTLSAVVSVLALSGAGAGLARADELGYVANEQAGTISQVDLTTGTVGTPIAVGSQPDGIAITPDDTTAYVADLGSSEIVPVTLATGSVGTPIALPDRPNAITISPDGSTAYAISGTGSEWAIALPLGTVGDTISIPTNSDGIAASPAGTTYIADAADDSLRPYSQSTGAAGTRLLLNATTPNGIAITPDGSTAWITSSSGGTVGADIARHGSSATNGFIQSVSLRTGGLGSPIQINGSASGIAISADGTAYVTDLIGGNLIPVSTATGKLETPINVGTDPSAFALEPGTEPAAGATDSGGSSSGNGDSASSTSTSGNSLPGTVSGSLGNQELTLAVAPAPGSQGSASSAAKACHAPGSTLRVTLRRQRLRGAAKLKFRHATFALLNKHKRVRRLPASARFSLRKFKAGAYTVSVRALYTELLRTRAGRSHGHKLAVPLTKTLKTRFTVC